MQIYQSVLLLGDSCKVLTPPLGFIDMEYEDGVERLGVPFSLFQGEYKEVLSRGILSLINVSQSHDRVYEKSSSFKDIPSVDLRDEIDRFLDKILNKKI